MNYRTDTVITDVIYSFTVIFGFSGGVETIDS